MKIRRLTDRLTWSFFFMMISLFGCLSPLFCEYNEQKCNEAGKKVDYYKDALDLHGDRYIEALERATKYLNLCKQAKEQVAKIVSNDYNYWEKVESIPQSERMRELIQPCRDMIEAIEKLDDTIEYNKKTYLKIKQAEAELKEYCKKEGDL
jgi:hypothetical protein